MGHLILIFKLSFTIQLKFVVLAYFVVDGTVYECVFPCWAVVLFDPKGTRPFATSPLFCVGI